MTDRLAKRSQLIGQRPGKITSWFTALGAASAVAAIILAVIANIYALYDPNSGAWKPVTLSSLAGALGSLFLVWVITSLIGFFPALLVSGLWESLGKQPSLMLYAIGGGITGFTGLVLLNADSRSLSGTIDALTHLVYSPSGSVAMFLVAGCLAGLTMAVVRRRQLNKLQQFW